MYPVRRRLEKLQERQRQTDEKTERERERETSFIEHYIEDMG